MNRFLRVFLLNEEMTEDEKEIVLYGVNIMLEMMISIFICLSIMCITRKFIEGVIFFAMFIPLRLYAGGYHCDKWWCCTLISSLSFWVMMCLAKVDIVDANKSFMVSIGAMAFILVIAPVINDTKPVLEEEFSKYAKRLYLFIALFVVIEIFLLYFDKKHYISFMTYVLCFMVIVLIVGKIKWKKLNKHNSYIERYIIHKIKNKSSYICKR